MGVTEASTWGWADARTIGRFAAGLLGLVLCLARSRSHPTPPAIEISLFGNRGFAVTNVVSLLYGMAQYPWLLVGVLYLTDTWRYSELQAGLAMTPGAIVASLTALNMGKVAQRLGGPRGVTLIGLVAILLCGFLMIFGLTHHRAFLALWMPAGFLVGIGMGATTMGTSSAAAFSAPPTKFAMGSGLNTMSRQFGGALGIAVLAVVLQGRTHADGTRPLGAYQAVYVFCTVVVGLALVVSYLLLRLTPVAPPAAAAATTAARPAASDTERPTRAAPHVRGRPRRSGRANREGRDDRGRPVPRSPHRAGDRRHQGPRPGGQPTTRDTRHDRPGHRAGRGARPRRGGRTGRRGW